MALGQKEYKLPSRPEELTIGQKSRNKVAIGDLAQRLSPDVLEIVRLDLIQKVGNALRFKVRTDEDIAALDSFCDEVIQKENIAQWATW